MPVAACAVGAIVAAVVVAASAMQTIAAPFKKRLILGRRTG
ncbi:hypothetical protein [Arthrobacter methylotrophus]